MTIVTATTELVATTLYLQRIRIFVVTSANNETCRLRCSLPCRLFSTQNQFETHPLGACWKMNMCMYIIYDIYIYIHIYQIIHHIYNVCRYQTNCLHWFQKIAKSSRHWGNFQGWHHVPTFMAWDCHRMVCSERLSSPETWKNPNKNDWNDFS